MEDGYSVIEHLNAFNTLVSQLVTVNIAITEEDKRINLLCSLPDSWDNLVVEIGSTTQSTLKYEDLVSSLLSEEMRWKIMDGHNIDALFVRGCSHDRNTSKSWGGRSKSTGRSKSPGKYLRKCWKCGKEEEEPHTPVLRRSVRERRKPKRYSPTDFHSNFSLSIIDDDPRKVREAVNSEDSKLWKKAMVQEMDSLDKNEAWDIVELLAGRKYVGRKWLFKKNFNAEGKVEKYKAWLVAKGYYQVEGIDLGEIFSLVSKLTSIRFLLSIVASFDIEVEHMDVKRTFLHGDLKEEIYMK
jgi:hypothetical protein